MSFEVAETLKKRAHAFLRNTERLLEEGRYVGASDIDVLVALSSGSRDLRYEVMVEVLGLLKHL